MAHHDAMRTPEQDDDAWRQLGAWYRDVRGVRGYTQAVVAQVSGVGYEWYRKIESGRTTAGKPVGRPTAEHLRRIEAALGVPVHSSDLVLAGADPGVDLANLEPITLSDTTPSGERVVYAGRLDVTRLTEAAARVAERYLRAG